MGRGWAQEMGVSRARVSEISEESQARGWEEKDSRQKGQYNKTTV